MRKTLGQDRRGTKKNGGGREDGRWTEIKQKRRKSFRGPTINTVPPDAWYT